MPVHRCIMMLQRNTVGLGLNLKAQVNEVMAINLCRGCSFTWSDELVYQVYHAAVQQQNQCTFAACIVLR